MLRLLQKRLTLTQLEFIKHAAFVVSAHIMMLVVVCASSKTAKRMVLNIKTFQQSRNVVIKWVPSRNKRQQHISTPPTVQMAVPVVPQKKVERKLFSTIDLGARKKRKKSSLYQPPQRPIEQPPEPIISAPVPEPVKNVAPEEPLVLSVQEYAEQQVFMEIVDAVRRWWQPPVGVNPQATCTIMVKISATGQTQEIVVQQSSGIPAYDIAAKSAVLKSNFPKVVWGKECVFQF